MVELSALASLAPGEQFPGSRIESLKRSLPLRRFQHAWHWHGEGVFLTIQGDQEVSGFLHDSPSMTLICHCDLLGTGSCSDFKEANALPASYIAALYERDGDAFVRDLHGWFAIILYDHRQSLLKAWTDHFGVRRLLYRAAAGQLAVASNLNLLNRLAGSDLEVDPVAVLEYLQYSCIPAPRTIYRGCVRLKPGHMLSSRPVPSQTQYWDMSYPVNRGGARREAVWAEETFEAIDSAVERALRPAQDSKNFGCFLSGGTDSSSVTGLTGRITGRPPRSFSIGFADPRYDETHYARIAARFFGADHHEYFVKADDIVTILPQAVAWYDEPFGNSSIIPAYFCARMAADSGVTLMLAGDGGDELFGGNERYADDVVFQRYARMPRWVRAGLIERLLPPTASMLRIPVLHLAERYVRRANIALPDRLVSYSFISSIAPEEVFSHDFHRELDGADPLSPLKKHFAGAPAREDLNRWLYFDLKLTITDNDVRKVTGMSDMAGVTTRYPLLDHSLATFSGTIPVELKVRGRRLRYIFKKAMQSFLPEEIIRKTKHGFGLPFSVWLGEHKPLRELVFDTLGSERSRQRGYFRADLLEYLWHRYETVHRNFFGEALWMFLMLELWHLHHYDAPRS